MNWPSALLWYERATAVDSTSSYIQSMLKNVKKQLMDPGNDFIVRDHRPQPKCMTTSIRQGSEAGTQELKIGTKQEDWEEGGEGRRPDGV